jgi:hypothetical protein
LKERLGQRALEADFFAAALRRVEGQRRKSTASGVLCPVRLILDNVQGRQGGADALVRARPPGRASTAIVNF